MQQIKEYVALSLNVLKIHSNIGDHVVDCYLKLFRIALIIDLWALNFYFELRNL